LAFVGISAIEIASNLRRKDESYLPRGEVVVYPFYGHRQQKTGNKIIREQSDKIISGVRPLLLPLIIIVGAVSVASLCRSSNTKSL
jgi:hypothetical protein